MKRRLALVSAVALANIMTAAACRNMPGPFAPPVQRQPLADFRPYRIAAIVDMSDNDAQSHFVKDILGQPTPAERQTGLRPTVRVRMRSVDDIRYTIDFAIPREMLAATGPLTVSFLVNDRVLDRARYTRAGSQHFEKPVPPGWVIKGEDVTVGAEVNKTWTTPEGGPKLGIDLVRMGLTQ